MATTTIDSIQNPNNPSRSEERIQNRKSRSQVIWWTIAAIVVIAAIVLFSVRSARISPATPQGAPISNVVPTTGAATAPSPEETNTPDKAAGVTPGFTTGPRTSTDTGSTTGAAMGMQGNPAPAKNEVSNAGTAGTDNTNTSYETNGQPQQNSTTDQNTK